MSNGLAPGLHLFEWVLPEESVERRVAFVHRVTMRDSSISVLVLCAGFLAIVAGCSGSDNNANAAASTGGAVAVGGSSSTGTATSVGGQSATGGRSTAGGSGATGGAPSTSPIGQACQAECSILSNVANLPCMSDTCVADCIHRYDHAQMSSCKAAYLALVQCAATQTAAPGWACYQSVIPIPRQACSAELNAIADLDYACVSSIAI
jgi:hypothetical protein